MTLTRVLCVLVPALLLVDAAPISAHSVPDGAQSHVRITDARLRMLFDDGLRNSATLRALVSRLEDSDVVVYLEPDAHGSAGFAGRLTFLSVVGGVRYVVVRITALPSTIQQIAMIGHELQHAVEIAERPEIVDADSMFREYLRMGYLRGSTGSGMTVDTRAAIESGARVAEELRSAGKLNRGDRACLVQGCAEVPRP